MDTAIYLRLNQAVDDLTRYRATRSAADLPLLNRALGVFRTHLINGDLLEATTPLDWARTCCNLAAALSFLPRQDADTVKESEYWYTNALRVFTEDDCRDDWATIQGCLAGLYAEAGEDEDATRLDKGLACGHAALRVLDKERRRVQWAMAHSNLALLYQRHVASAPGALERAIEHTAAAEEVFTWEADPAKWGDLTLNLSLAYQAAAVAMRDANHIIRAIELAESVLDRVREDALPFTWAQAELARGRAHEIVASMGAEDIALQCAETAHRCYTSALRVFTQDAFPTLWQRTSESLQRVRSLQQMLKPSSGASTPAAPEADSDEASPTEADGTELGAASARHGELVTLLTRLMGGPIDDESVARTIALLQAILLEQPESTDAWAMTHFYLGVAYATLTTDQPHFADAALGHFRQSLRVLTPETHHGQWEDVQLWIAKVQAVPRQRPGRASSYSAVKTRIIDRHAGSAPLDGLGTAAIMACRHGHLLVAPVSTRTATPQALDLCQACWRDGAVESLRPLGFL